jgi:ketosteroid isomerase-like protein
MTTDQKLAELTARVQVLEDEAAIRRLMADIMATADDRENPKWGERMASFYTDDGQWTSGAGFADVGMAERGRAALVRKFTAGTRIAESSHLLGTESIEVQGDGANGSWLCFEPVTLNTPGGGKEAAWIMGRYTCEFRRVDGRWWVRTVQYDGIFCTPYEKGWTNERFMSIRPLPGK